MAGGAESRDPAHRAAHPGKPTLARPWLALGCTGGSVDNGPEHPRAGQLDSQRGAAGHSSAPVPASPTDSQPCSPASSWHQPGGFSGDSLEAPQGAGAGPGQQGFPHVWHHPQPQSWAGELHRDGIGAANTNPEDSPSPSPMRGQAEEPGRGTGPSARAQEGDAWGSHCRWWERRVVGIPGSAAGRRGLLAARDPKSIWVLCRARVWALFTSRAPIRTKDMEKPTRTSSIPASCPSHEAACHHRHHQKGKEQPPQPLPTPLVMATLMHTWRDPHGKWDRDPSWCRTPA